jgi:hypothetical protein
MLHGGAVAGLVDQPLMRFRLHARAATADRGRTLALSACWLASVPDRVRMTPALRRLVFTKARGERGRAARALAQEALAADAPDARVRVLKLALTRAAGISVRLAAATTLAPRSARRRIANLG